MRTLREDGARKVLAGMTTPEEVIRATTGDTDLICPTPCPICCSWSSPKGAADLHLRVDCAPVIRLHGDLHRVEGPKLKPEDTED